MLKDKKFSSVPTIAVGLHLFRKAHCDFFFRNKRQITIAIESHNRASCVADTYERSVCKARPTSVLNRSILGRIASISFLSSVQYKNLLSFATLFVGTRLLAISSMAPLNSSKGLPYPPSECRPVNHGSLNSSKGLPSPPSECRPVNHGSDELVSSTRYFRSAKRRGKCGESIVVDLKW